MQKYGERDIQKQIRKQKKCEKNFKRKRELRKKRQEWDRKRQNAVKYSPSLNTLLKSNP